MRRILGIILIISGLFSCQSSSYLAQHHPKLDDQVFADYTLQPIETADEVFSLNPEIREFVDANTKQGHTDKRKLAALVEAIFDRDNLSLSYIANANTTAIDTFNSRTANCLSLTIMTYAMTQYLGLDSEFQDVQIPEFWTRKDGNTLINRHINLIVKPHNLNMPWISSVPLLVDFDPQQEINQFKVRPLDQAQILSYFYANKAADFQLANQHSQAYAYLKAAIQQYSGNEGAWLNLGVLFSQTGHFTQAQVYYEYALSLKPNYASGRENLALLYRKLGDTDKANRQLAKLHKERLKNPFYHVMLGDIAFDDKTYAKAIQHYKKAIALDRRHHAFYFSVAKAYYASGDTKNTQRYLTFAKRKAKGMQKEQQYASKITALIAKR